MGRVFHMSENTMLVPQMGINMEQATANCEELAKAIHEITAGAEPYFYSQVLFDDTLF